MSGQDRTVRPGTSSRFPPNASVVYETLANTSIHHQINTIGDETAYALLGPVDPPDTVDYSASTFAVSTQCIPIFRLCYTGASAANCSKARVGLGVDVQINLVSPWDLKSIDSNSSATTGATASATTYNDLFEGTRANPWRWVLGAALDTSFPLSGLLSNITDPDVGVLGNGDFNVGATTIISCNTSGMRGAPTHL